MKKPHVRIFLLCLAVLTFAGSPVLAQERLPIYRVVPAPISVNRPQAFAAELGVSPAVLSIRGSAISYVDKSVYLATQSDVSAFPPQLSADSVNRFPSIPLLEKVYEIPRMAPQAEISPLVAAARIQNVLHVAGLSVDGGTPIVGHDVLTLYAWNQDHVWTKYSTPLDTTVSYSFTTPNGYPLEGPGAEAEATVAGGGRIAQFHYDVEQLAADRYVSIIPKQAEREKIASWYPRGTRIGLRLVYLAPTVAPGETSFAVPCYEYQVMAPGAKQTARPIGFESAIQTSGSALSVSLESWSVGSTIYVKAMANGGTPPYRYMCEGSNPYVSQKGNIASYIAVRKALPLGADATGFVINRNEKVQVDVYDYYSHHDQGTTTTTVMPFLAYPTAPMQIAYGPTYGCLSPDDPGKFSQCRIAWENTMHTPNAGAGTERFCWLGANVWPGDFIEPSYPGKLVREPWIYGDADFANWGVNTADLVIDIADGDPDGICCSEPGAVPSATTVARVQSPVDKYQVVVNMDTAAEYYKIPCRPWWGTVGPNDRLCWLLLDDCSCFADLDAADYTAPQRWGGVANGVHVVTCFTDGESGSGAFEAAVAEHILGLGGPPKTIVQSWFDAAAESQNCGTPAAMGPALILPDHIHYYADFDDHYWGKGQVGPTIVPSHYTNEQIGYWTIVGPTPKPAVFN